MGRRRAAGRPEPARDDYAEALLISGRVGTPRSSILCLEGLAVLAQAHRATALAVRLTAAAAAARGRVGRSLDAASRQALAWARRQR